MRILFLSRWFPDPPNNGSRLRIYNLLQGLCRHHQVTLISFYNPLEGIPQRANLQSICEDIRLVPWREYQPDSRRSLLGYFSLIPRYFGDTYSDAMRDEIVQAVQNGNFDRVIASQVDMAAYAPYLDRTPALFEEAEVGILYDQFQQAKNPLDRFRFGLTWAKHRGYMLRLLNLFRACTVVSEQEGRLIKEAILPTLKVSVIPNCVDLTHYAGNWTPSRPNSLIFSGSFSFNPNYEGMLWFINEVYPHIIGQIPDTQLTITGDQAGRQLPVSPGVTHKGYVGDVRPFIAGSMCSIAPILQGGGTRLKILEAMALGTPVVATSKGAEGLDVQNGVHLLVADQPIEFGKAVVRLFREPELRVHLAENALRLVKNRYDWKGIMPGFLELVQNLGYN